MSLKIPVHSNFMILNAKIASQALGSLLETATQNCGAWCQRWQAPLLLLRARSVPGVLMEYFLTVQLWGPRKTGESR